MRTHGLTDPVIALRRQTDYQFSPNWLSGAEDELSYVKKYQPDGKQPYLMAHLEDFAALRKMITKRRRDKIEIVAPVHARAVDIKKLRSLGVVRIQMSKVSPQPKKLYGPDMKVITSVCPF
jgi:hypothetical protein